jgi:branched-subunit amino acid aminotransferase/4-amino-4-deoxychorismate lyase
MPQYFERSATRPAGMHRRPGCYTTARVAGGRPWLAERHVARLRRDAARLGLPPPSEAECRRALADGAARAGGRGEGILRLELRAGEDGRARLWVTARPLGSDPLQWTALSAPLLHGGPGPAPGVKLLGRPDLEAARRAAREAGADEALLFDAEGRLVEGARSSLVVVTEEGAWRTPPLGRGGVAGLAREIALGGLAGLEEADVSRGELVRAREIVALNAVRGARPIVRLDGAPVGPGRPGPLAGRLAALLRRVPSGTLPAPREAP